VEGNPEEAKQPYEIHDTSGKATFNTIVSFEFELLSLSYSVCDVTLAIFS